MVIRITAFTTKGWELVLKIEELMGEHLIEKKSLDEDTDAFIKNSFKYNLPLIFVGSCGIAVRKISPYVNDKTMDSPVIVIDEKGKFVVPILSNHLGGANKISCYVAKLIGAQAVITTATDVNNKFAVDIFAQNNGLIILNKERIKTVSSKILNDEKIRMAISPSFEINKTCIPDSVEIVSLSNNKGEIDVYVASDMSEINDMEANGESSSCVLKLLFKPYALGIGCRKNIDFEKLDSFIVNTLCSNNIDINHVFGMASLDLKKKERGLLYFSSKYRISFSTFDSEELNSLAGDFSKSDFVREVTGVSNVCERSAAMLAGAKHNDSGIEEIMSLPYPDRWPKKVLEKTAKDGMTLSVYRRKERIEKWET